MATLPGLQYSDDIVQPSPKRVKLQEAGVDDEENADAEFDDDDFYGTPKATGTPVKSEAGALNNQSNGFSQDSATVPFALPGLGSASPSKGHQYSAREDPKDAHSTAEIEDREIEDDLMDDFYGDEEQKVDRSQAQEQAIRSHAYSAPVKAETGLEPPRSAAPYSPRSQEMDAYASVVNDGPSNEAEPEVDRQSSTTAEGDVILAVNAPKNDTEFLQAAEENKQDPEAEWRFDSSDAESSDGSTDSTSSSDGDSEADSSDEEDLLDPAAQAKMLLEAIGDDEDAAPSGPLRTANETVEDIIPKPDIVVTPEMKITELGNVDSIVGNLVLIKAKTSGDFRVLEAGSALCLADRTVVGAVMETIGKVQKPMYSLGVKAAKELEDAGVVPGTTIYYVDEHSTFVFTQALKSKKGTDASNLFDEEAGVEEIEFSDDEKEAEYKRNLKNKKKAQRLDRTAGQDGQRANRGGPNKQAKFAPAKSAHPDSDVHYAQPTSINYDDEDVEEMYRPLKRPDNLHQMMTFREPIEDRANRGRPFHRGGGRGGQAGWNDRGRGGGRGGFRGGGRGGHFDRGPQRGGYQNHHAGQRGGKHRGGRHSSRDRTSPRQESPKTTRQHNSPQSRDPRLRRRQNENRPGSSRSSYSGSHDQSPSIPPPAPATYSAPPTVNNNAAYAQNQAQMPAFNPLALLQTISTAAHVHPALLAQLPNLLALVQQQQQQPQQQQQQPQYPPFLQWPQMPTQQAVPAQAPQFSPTPAAIQQQQQYQPTYGQQTIPRGTADSDDDPRANLERILQSLTGGNAGQH